MKKAIAFFDVDGTLTRGDTFLANIRYQKGTWKCWLGFAWLSPWILAYKIGILSNQTAKEKALRLFFGGMKEADFRTQCEAFARNELPKMLRAKGIAEIEKHEAIGHQVVLVTASAAEWIAGGFKQFSHLQIEGTRLEIVDGKITGRILGKNCYGEEKVRRINPYLKDFQGPTYGYGDTKGDLPLLRKTTFRFYKPFR